MKVISYFAEALVEIQDALDHSPKPTVFRREIDEALNDIASGLMTHAKIPRSQLQECILLGYPYSIIYHELTDEIRVVAFAHHKRRRGYWKPRLRKP